MGRARKIWLAAVGAACVQATVILSVAAEGSPPAQTAAAPPTANAINDVSGGAPTADSTDWWQPTPYLQPSAWPQDAWLDIVLRAQNAFRPRTRRVSPHRKPAPSLLTGVDLFRTPQLTSGLATIVNNMEARLRKTTDSADMLSTPSSLGTIVIRRSPIIHDDKNRGSRTGQALRSGSYWVAARMDLDTALSKIDSRLVEDILVVRGPYSASYGPGFRFVDFQLLPSPRFESGFDSQHTTSLEYQTNGQQWYGRQIFAAGNENSGLRISYGHRTGNDYQTGDGVDIPASYKSRDWDVAYGIDVTPETNLEFHYLRQDQTDVELAGQAFDLDHVVTDAFEITLQSTELFSADFELSTWYNRTDLAGSAQRAGKRRQFPVFDTMNFAGRTDVDSMSTGYTAAWTHQHEAGHTTVGTDLRYVRQELNEITSADFGQNFWVNRNSPIPRAHSSNPGLFWETSHAAGEFVVLSSGARLDWLSANIDDDPNKLQDVGTRAPFEDPLSLADILGSEHFDRDFTLGAVYMMAEAQLTSYLNSTLAYGYAERAPNLTELYAAQPFMFLLQNGLNTITGNPELNKERLWQLDAGLDYDNGRLRAGLSGFHGWVRDYITYENLRTTGDQVNLKFVNTHLATLAGGEFYTEYQWTPRLTTFSTVSYVEGRDHTRDGDSATVRAVPGIPSTPSSQVAGAPRGSFSDTPPVPAADEEPLPNMAPLTRRLGVRFHDPAADPLWSLEISARLVDDQNRVATSLLESTTRGFTVWDLRAYCQATDALKLIFGVENFTDRQYREYLDFRGRGPVALQVSQPGANFYFASEWVY